MEKQTFSDLYRQQPSPNMIQTPKKRWVKDIALITHKSEKTVRAWVYGDQEPDALTKDVLATYFNCNPEDLFPPKN